MSIRIVLFKNLFPFEYIFCYGLKENKIHDILYIIRKVCSKKVYCCSPEINIWPYPLLSWSVIFESLNSLFSKCTGISAFINELRFSIKIIRIYSNFYVRVWSWSFLDGRMVYSSLLRSITFSMRSSRKRLPESECPSWCLFGSCEPWLPQQPIPPLRKKIRYTKNPIKIKDSRFCMLYSSFEQSQGLFLFYFYDPSVFWSSCFFASNSCKGLS